MTEPCNGLHDCGIQIVVGAEKFHIDPNAKPIRFGNGSMKTIEEHNREARRAQYLTYEPASVSCTKCGLAGKGVEMRFIPLESTYFNGYNYLREVSVVCPECETREAMENKPKPTFKEETILATSGAHIHRTTWSDGRVSEKVTWPDPNPTITESPEPPVRRQLPPVEPKKRLSLMSEIEMARSAILWVLFVGEVIAVVWQHFWNK